MKSGLLVLAAVAIFVRALWNYSQGSSGDAIFQTIVALVILAVVFRKEIAEVYWRLRSLHIP